MACEIEMCFQALSKLSFLFLFLAFLHLASIYNSV